MSKTKSTSPVWSFEFYQNPDDPKLFTSRYVRGGEILFEVKDAAYNVCAAAMEKRLRLAPFSDVVKVPLQ